MWSRAGVGLAAELRNHLAVHHHAARVDHLLGVPAAGDTGLRQNLLQPFELDGSRGSVSQFALRFGHSSSPAASSAAVRALASTAA